MVDHQVFKLIHHHSLQPLLFTYLTPIHTHIFTLPCLYLLSDSYFSMCYIQILETYWMHCCGTLKFNHSADHLPC